jgi:pimeloyl-ACP methyl ester carboxylesterase
MELQRWSHPTSAGFSLRGWHSPPSGKPVLQFVHGNGFCSRSYQPMLRRLHDHFDLWLVDVQGQGESDAGEAFVGWHGNGRLLEETTHALRERFGDAARYALGHSFGGVATAYLLAAQTQLFRRAVLLDPVLFSPMMISASAFSTWLGRDPPGGMSERARRRRHTWPNREAAHVDLYDRGIFKGWDDEALRAHIAHALRDNSDGSVSLRCAPDLEATIFASWPKALWPTLRRVRTPTLVLHGDVSYPFVGASARRWAKACPNVTERQVQGGHCFMQQHPADTARAVSDFLLTETL